MSCALFNYTVIAIVAKVLHAKLAQRGRVDACAPDNILQLARSIEEKEDHVDLRTADVACLACSNPGARAREIRLFAAPAFGSKKEMSQMTRGHRSCCLSLVG